MKVLSLRELGRALLGVRESDGDRLGGPEHRYWKRRLAEHLTAAGYEVTEEAPLGGGRTVDLLAVKDGKRIAVEVETGKSDAAANVRKCLAVGVERVLVVATNRQAYADLARAVPCGPAVKLLSAAEAERHGGPVVG